MPVFNVGTNAKPNGPFGIKFSRVPMLGNAGAKIDAVLEHLLDPSVDAPKVPPPAEKKALEVIGLTPRIELKALADFFTGGSRQLNPANGEPRNIRVAPLTLTAEEIAAAQQLAALLNITPTWRADP